MIKNYNSWLNESETITDEDLHRIFDFSFASGIIRPGNGYDALTKKLNTKLDNTSSLDLGNTCVLAIEKNGTEEASPYNVYPKLTEMIFGDMWGKPTDTPADTIKIGDKIWESKEKVDTQEFILEATLKSIIDIPLCIWDSNSWDQFLIYFNEKIFYAALLKLSYEQLKTLNSKELLFLNKHQLISQDNQEKLRGKISTGRFGLSDSD